MNTKKLIKKLDDISETDSRDIFKIALKISEEIQEKIKKAIVTLAGDDEDEIQRIMRAYNREMPKKLFLDMKASPEK